MNMQKKIEQSLRAAPKPPAPAGLLDKLQADISAWDMKTQRSALRMWFAPTGGRFSLWRVAAAAAVAIVVLLPLSYGATKLIKRFITISQLPAISLRSINQGAALSPDGKQFAGIAGRNQLTVIDLSSDERRNVAEKCTGDVVWSADGSEIAVYSYGPRPALLAVSPKTGKTRTLMENPQPPIYLYDWSPDGKLILGDRTPTAEIVEAVLVNLETKKETVLAKHTADYSLFPHFSPKGDLVSYVTKEGDRYILHLQKIDGTSHVKYMDFPGEIRQPLWSPDSSHIVFTGTQKGFPREYKDLWALRVQGNQFIGAPLPVVPDVGQIKFYNWSQNGQLAYRMGFELGGIFVLLMDSQTGKPTGVPRQLVRAGGFPMHCWSPDGKQIAVLRQKQLTFVSASTGEQIRQVSLPEVTQDGRGMSWSPDGKLIAFPGLVDRENKTGIFLITVESGDVKLLVPLEAPAYFDPSWAPDSKTIVYRTGLGVIYFVNIEDGKPRSMNSPSEHNEDMRVWEQNKNKYEEWLKRARIRIWPVFAPDGSSVAYILCGQKSGTVMATTIDGKETREIFQLKNNKSVHTFDWSPDGRHIVFSSADKEIWCAPTDGSEPFQIADISALGDYALMPKWSPKGDAITFYVAHEESRFWVMENFLPAAEAGGR